MKIIYFIVLTALLLACSPLTDETSSPGIETIPPPTGVATIPRETVAANTPWPTRSDCLHLIAPIDGSTLRSVGPVNFEWEQQIDTQFYILMFTYPNGLTANFKTQETNLKRYIETMPMGGSYKWGVAAYGLDGSKICSSVLFSFSKSELSSAEHRSDEEEQQQQAENTPIAPPAPPATPTQ